MSALGSALADYLALRRGLGYKLENPGRLLSRFVAHLDATGAETVTVALALSWSAEAGQRGAADRMEAIRGFARYLQALDPVHEVPPAGLVAESSHRAIPRLYSDGDVTALMATARALSPALRAATTETVIGLLAVTGMRIGEVLALDVDDVDWAMGVIGVRGAKFGSGRNLPVESSTLAALDDYRQRHRVPAGATPALFVAPAGGRLRYPAFAETFRRLLDATGIGATEPRPRIHDVRHSFAVKTILGWYRQGADVHALLPRLSTYLGHTGPAATYWYLSAAPELMAIAAERLEHHHGGGRL